MRLIFATRNPGKVKEMREILHGIDVQVLSMEEVGISDDIVEDGKTFEENARKKAEFVVEKTREWTFGEDSGICIATLDDAPGVYSARWAGENVSEDQLVNFTLAKMKGVKARGASFETAVVLMAPDKRAWVFNGKVDGRISESTQGAHRPKLPYDVIFIPKGYTKTFAEMTDREKNILSHRGRAFAELKQFLTTISVSPETEIVIMQNMSYFIILRGPLGCGKTTIAKRLAQLLRAGHISIDEVLSKLGLDKVDPDVDGIPVKNFIKANEAVLPKARDLLGSGKVVIFDACFYHKEAIDHLINNLPFPHYVFTLKVPVEVCIARDKGRSRNYGEDAARAVYGLVSRFNYGISIDASGSLESTVDAIRAHLL